MKQFIENLLPRIRQFSNTLDRKELFIEVPWVVIDEEGNQQKYIFRKNGELIMSLNGQVNSGKWEYLPAAKSLLIDRKLDKILLNQNYMDGYVMILKKDGYKDENMILANELLLPSLDVQNHLRKIFYTKNFITIFELLDGSKLEVYEYDGYTISGNRVTIEGIEVPDGIKERKDGLVKYIIKGSRISKFIERKRYESNKGIIWIEQQASFNISKGDIVFQNGEIAPDGKYRLGLFHSLLVKQGIIIKN